MEQEAGAGYETNNGGNYNIEHMEYLFQEKSDHTVHEISYDKLKLLFEDNKREAAAARRMTKSSYRGENFYTQHGDNNYALYKEVLERDPQTSGMRLYYPHGVVIEQAERKKFLSRRKPTICGEPADLAENVKEVHHDPGKGAVSVACGHADCGV